MISRGFGVYDRAGMILFACAWDAPIDVESVRGSYVWEHFSEPMQPLVRIAFEMALEGLVSVPVRGALSREKYPAPLLSSCRFHPTGIAAAPVAGMFQAVPLAVSEFTFQQRHAAALLTTHSAKEVARILGLSIRTVESLKTQLADNLGVPKQNLLATLSKIQEML